MEHSSTAKNVVLSSPCKVNYRLDVLSRREDGYHDLRMIMQRINLCDTIEISTGGPSGVRVSCGNDAVPDGPGNIAWRAAAALLELSAEKPGIDIAITKRIPVAAGLGGGSSNCATVLTGLNDLLGLGLSLDRLMEIGLKLGADVPFFVFGKTAIAEGIGEVLTEIERVPKLWIVLVNPGFGVNTGWVYRNLDLTALRHDSTMPRFFESATEVCAVLKNDLESVTIREYPVIGEIKERLLREGACGSLMSGSGATVFGVFAAEGPARRCAEKIAAETGWFAAAAETL